MVVNTEEYQDHEIVRVSDFYKPWDKQVLFHLCGARFRLQVGGFGCIAKDTEIANGITVKDWSGGLVRGRYVGPSFLKGISSLYRVTTRSGKQVVVTDAHRFLSPAGWYPLSCLRAGDSIAADDTEHVFSGKGTPEDFRGHYSLSLHRCDGLLHPFEAAVLRKLQQFRKIGVCNSALQAYAHLSIENSFFRGQYPFSSSADNLHGLTDAELLPRDWRTEYQSPAGFRSTPRRHEDNGVRFQTVADAPVFSRGLYCASEIQNVPREYGLSFWDEIERIEYVGRDTFYDLTVPGFEHYSAHGLWHHNSGKSRPLLMEAILYCLEYPGINAALVRKTMPDLKRTVIDKFKSDVPKALYERGSQAKGTYNDSDKIVYFPPVPKFDANGKPVIETAGKQSFLQSKLYFVACERVQDVSKYLSTEFAFVGFEELGEFPFAIWDAFEGRNRCSIPGVRSCMAGATNPMGPGWGWIKKLFIDKKPTREMDAEKYDPREYWFVHSTVDDNPIYREDKEYISTLEKSPLRDRIRYGKLDVVSGQYFQNWMPKIHMVKKEELAFAPWHPIWIGWDYGFGHYACITFWTKATLKPRIPTEQPRIVNVTIGELVLKEQTPEQQANAVVAYLPRIAQIVGIHKQLRRQNASDEMQPDDFFHEQVERDEREAAEADGPKAIVPIDSIHFSWERFIPTTKTPGGQKRSVADEVGDIMAANGLPRPIRSNTDRVAGFTKMYSMLEDMQWFVLESECPTLCEAIPLVVRGDGVTCSLEDVVKPKGLSLEDDMIDACRYGVAGVLLDEGEKPEDVKLREKLAGIKDPMRKHVEAYRAYNKKQKEQQQGGREIVIPSWVNKLRHER